MELFKNISILIFFIVILSLYLFINVLMYINKFSKNLDSTRLRNDNHNNQYMFYHDHSYQCYSIIKYYKYNDNDVYDIHQNHSFLFPFPKIYSIGEYNDSKRYNSNIRFHLHSNFKIDVYYDYIVNNDTTLYSLINKNIQRYCNKTAISWKETSLEDTSRIKVNNNLDKNKDNQISIIKLIITNESLIHSNNWMNEYLANNNMDSINHNSSNKKIQQQLKNEMYSICIDINTNITIKAHNYRGVVNALSTLDQIFSRMKIFTVPLPLHIIDWPDNIWRG